MITIRRRNQAITEGLDAIGGGVALRVRCTRFRAFMYALTKNPDRAPTVVGPTGMAEGGGCRYWRMGICTREGLPIALADTVNTSVGCGPSVTALPGMGKEQNGQGTVCTRSFGG